MKKLIKRWFWVLTLAYIVSLALAFGFELGAIYFLIWLGGGVVFAVLAAWSGYYEEVTRPDPWREEPQGLGLKINRETGEIEKY